ncbi:MAG: CBS domain-containing protein [Candidatus Altiarchaeota archaeon]
MTSVSEIMSSPVFCVESRSSIKRVAQLMADHGIGCLIVTSQDGNMKIRDVGIITERDIVKRVAAKDLIPSKTKVEDVMTKPVVSLPLDAPVEEASEVMKEKNIRRLPITDKDTVVGMITIREVHLWLRLLTLRKALGRSEKYFRHD